MSYAILRTAKLKTIGNISGSLAHTYRTIDTPNADASRTHLNDNSLPTHADALQAIKDKLPEKTRKNGVLCIEYLITASPDWGGFGSEKQGQYFNDAIDWLKQKHGADNVVMTGIQLDETTPHLVAYVVPYDSKGKLNCRHFLGGRDKMTAMQTDFADKVGKRFGLERGEEGSKAKHEEVKKFYADIKKGVEVDLELPKPRTLELSVNSYRERVTGEVKEQLADTLKSMQSQLTRKDKELKNVKQQLKLTRAELDKVNEKTKVYQDAKTKVIGVKTLGGVELDKQITKIADNLHRVYSAEIEQSRQLRQAEQARMAEHQRQVEQARLARLGVDVVADGRSVYSGKVFKVDEQGAYQKTKQGVVLHPTFTNLEVGHWSIDYEKRQATPQADLSGFKGQGKERSGGGMDLG